MADRNIGKIIEELGKFPSAKRILLQAPEGLKTQLIDISKELETLGYEIYISMNPCYGACDLPIGEAKRLGADAILHLGHKEFYVKPKSDVPIIYAEWHFDAKISEKLKDALKNIGEN